METVVSFLLTPINSARRLFWSESIWLPPNVTWGTYERRENGVDYARFNDLYYSIITAVILLGIRFTFEKYIYTPMGLRLGMKQSRRKKVPENPILEKALYGKLKLGHKQVVGLAKQLDWTERQVERWFRIRKSRDKPTTLTKFTESAWRCTFYFCAFIFGLYTLYGKPWMWDSIHCFIDYPHHSISNEVWVYFNVELGFYLSLIVSQFFDIQRKDFWQMFIHHIVTVMLLCFSWACNLHRCGTLVLIIHDFADVPLEGAKLSRYMRTPRIADVVFAVFTVCWIYSRLGLLPYRVIAYSSYHALSVVPMFPAYYIFNALLCALQILHIVWTWLILRIAHNAMFKDGVKDLRESDETTIDEQSDSEEVDFVTETVKKQGNVLNNGHANGTLASRIGPSNGNNNQFSQNSAHHEM